MGLTVTVNPTELSEELGGLPDQEARQALARDPVTAAAAAAGAEPLHDNDHVTMHLNGKLAPGFCLLSDDVVRSADSFRPR